eukprot:5012619-Amphidinium_carterae.2
MIPWPKGQAPKCPSILSKASPSNVTTRSFGSAKPTRYAGDHQVTSSSLTGGIRPMSRLTASARGNKTDQKCWNLSGISWFPTAESVRAISPNSVPCNMPSKSYSTQPFGCMVFHWHSPLEFSSRVSLKFRD